MYTASGCMYMSTNKNVLYYQPQWSNCFCALYLYLLTMGYDIVIIHIFNKTNMSIQVHNMYSECLSCWLPVWYSAAVLPSCRLIAWLIYVAGKLSVRAKHKRTIFFGVGYTGSVNGLAACTCCWQNTHLLLERTLGEKKEKTPSILVDNLCLMAVFTNFA